MNVITFNLEYDKPNQGSVAPLKEIIEKILSLPLSETFKTSFCYARAECRKLDCTHAHNEKVNLAGQICRDTKLADKKNRLLQNAPIEQQSTKEAIEEFNRTFDDPKAKVYVKPKFIANKIISYNLPEGIKTTLCDKAENCKNKICRFAHHQVVFDGGIICQQKREAQLHQANNSPQMQNAIVYNRPTIDPVQAYLATVQSLMNGMNQHLMSLQYQLQMSYQQAPPQYSEINNNPQNSTQLSTVNIQYQNTPVYPTQQMPFIENTIRSQNPSPVQLEINHPLSALNVQYQNPPAYRPPQSLSPVQIQAETEALGNDTLQNLSNLQRLQKETTEVESETWESWEADLKKFKEQP